MKNLIRNNLNLHQSVGLRQFIFIVFILIGSVYGYSQFFGGPQLGKAEPQIETQVKYEEGLILFNFDLDESYHITDLKNNFFKIQLEKNEFIEIIDTVFPKGVSFGEEMVFKGKFTVKVYVKSLIEVSEPVKLNFKVSYQICQEKPQEVCFPPEDLDVPITIEQSFAEVEVEREGKALPASQSSGLEDLSSTASLATYKPKGGNWPVLLTIALTQPEIRKMY